jgi:hypothetical protein
MQPEGGLAMAEETTTTKTDGDGGSKAATEGGNGAGTDTTKATVQTDPKRMSEDELRSFAERQVQENQTLKAELETQRADSKKMSERLAIVEQESQTKKFTDEVMGKSDANGERWYGEPEKHVAHLTDLARAFGEGSDQVKFYIETERAHAKQMREAGTFKVVGSAADGTAGGSALSQLEAKARAFTEADPKMTKEQAMARAAAENPALYRDYERELRSR